MRKYEYISNEMRKRIQGEYYPIDQPIPDELSLAKEFSCSRMTMKRALDILVSEGMLYRKRGHGTFIVKSSIQNVPVSVTDRENIGLTKLLANKQIDSHIIQFDVEFPPDEVAKRLSIEKTVPVYHIIRLRKVEGEPYVIEETYMPANVISELNEEVLHGSVYRHITETLKLTIAGSHRTIRADKPTELDRQHLECAADDPVLEVEQVAFLNTGEPFEYSFARHRYDKFVFSSVHIRK
ncbi:GntR family transcriptional regulator [Bacillus swezeyi]|uniref:GntR family transcriptional regulator n=1 Tax=Bacillus swezeyi TaxID=1925020 RepID=A0A5M8RW57_9BACI|nr:GntR family transcriptional regulator [Bacillus swezeyi]KAA6451543.1 GntR family transcriptional regulator [Bacillus swezeyi]KAA6482350.1 GntR family transcriptional regulator [Bacillus swezeyi]TYS35764.1 GntR family transcriptional regulator [Bacillus swezeyi]